MTEEAKTAATPKRARKMAREPKADVAPISAETEVAQADKPGQPQAAAAKPPTKASIILALLQRDEGATLVQLVEATGWLPHTTRAALTGLKRRGHTLSSEKIDGVRTYRVANEVTAA